MAYANYHVGLKILLRKGNDVLFLHSASKEFLDLPGGRIDDSEDSVSVIDVLHREIREELGGSVQYEVGEPLFQYRRFVKNRFRIFLTVYDGVYLGGYVQISDEHSDYEWIDPQKRRFTVDDFFHKEEYEAFLKHFSKR